MDCCSITIEEEHELRLCQICRFPTETLKFYCYSCFDLLFNNYRVTKYELLDYLARSTNHILIGNMEKMNLIKVYLCYKIFYPHLPLLNILLEKILYIKLHMALYQTLK